VRRARLVLRLALFALLLGCRRDETAKVDEPLMAYLSKARALHHQANLYEDSGDVPAAIGALERILRDPPPSDGPEAREVQADVHARLTELELKRNQVANAEQHAQAGLLLTAPDTYYRGHLLEVSGLALEAKSYALADAGDLPGAVSAREAAIHKLEQAITVQERVIGTAIGNDGGGAK
jgi:tetratricopeptide (TPR) repeat protein